MSLADHLKKNLKPAAPREPLWKGPEKDGITYSMLSRFLVCRERFRLKVIEGLTGEIGWDHKIGYGDMWHECEDALASRKPDDPHKMDHVLRRLKDYASGVRAQFPMDQEKVVHWYRVCREQFPVYVDYWAKHPDVMARSPLMQEEVFCVPLQLPSKRVVLLRGKWDSVDMVRAPKQPKLVWIQENKTKGDIKEMVMQRQLKFDLQSMIYVVALQTLQGYAKNGLPKALSHLEEKVLPEPAHFGNLCWTDERIAGVRYNVIRRPLSGGKGNIVQHKPSKSNPAGETADQFYARLRDDYLLEFPETFFMRWNVDIRPGDITRFLDECLYPLLEQLSDWWEWVSFCHREGARLWDNDVTFNGDPSGDGRPHASAIHWRHPFGVYNVLNEGGSSDFDEYMETGSTVGLRRVETLFPELQPKE